MRWTSSLPSSFPLPPPPYYTKKARYPKSQTYCISHHLLVISITECSTHKFLVWYEKATLSNNPPLPSARPFKSIGFGFGFRFFCGMRGGLRRRPVIEWRCGWPWRYKGHALNEAFLTFFGGGGFTKTERERERERKKERQLTGNDYVTRCCSATAITQTPRPEAKSEEGKKPLISIIFLGVIFLFSRLQPKKKIKIPLIS
jgi:hypothetical protein